MNWTMPGALWGLLGVGLGAFGAHGLRAVTTSRASPGGKPRRATSSSTRWPSSSSASCSITGPAATRPAGRSSSGAPSSAAPSTPWPSARRVARRRHPDRRPRDDARLAAPRASRAKVAGGPRRGAGERPGGAHAPPGYGYTSFTTRPARPPSPTTTDRRPFSATLSSASISRRRMSVGFCCGGSARARLRAHGPAGELWSEHRPDVDGLALARVLAHEGHDVRDRHARQRPPAPLHRHDLSFHRRQASAARTSHPSPRPTRPPKSEKAFRGSPRKAFVERTTRFKPS